MGLVGVGGLVVVPPPTGDAATDTPNALEALNCPAGTTVQFQGSLETPYVIDQELPVPPGVRVTGQGSNPATNAGGSIATLQQANGTSLECIMASAGYLAGLYKTPQYGNGTQKRYADTAIEVDHLIFNGGNGGPDGGGNTEGHGVVLYSVAAVVHDCSFIDIAESAIVVADCNYAGRYCKDQNFENRVTDNWIVNPGQHGIWTTHTPGAIGATDGYMMGNVIESPSGQQFSAGPVVRATTGLPYEGIRMDNAAGWWVCNQLLQACPGNGIYVNTTWGVHLLDNVIDGFGCVSAPKTTYYGIYIITSGATKTHPGFLTGNVAVAYTGTNPYGQMAPDSTTTFIFFGIFMQLQSYDVDAWFEQSANAAHQGSQTPDPIFPAEVTGGSSVVSIPNGSGAGTQAGMSIADSFGRIPHGTTILNVAPGTDGEPDRLTISAAATADADNDTVDFLSPVSTAWTYQNDEPGSVMTVHRTNEVITGTIDASLLISGSAIVNVLDPLDMAGVPVSGSPAAGKVVIATSPSAAAWGTLSDTGPVIEITQMQTSGVYTIPTGATKLRITCIGGGGGGGGGGSSSSSSRAAQVGGGGGAAGAASQQVVDVGTNSSLTVSIGAGGKGGTGGEMGAAGTKGERGEATSVRGAGIAVHGSGGPGGAGSAGGSSVPVGGGAYGGPASATSQQPNGGCGGASGVPGGHPTGMSAGGGGGGGSSSSGSGGAGGGAGSNRAGGTAGTAGAAPAGVGGTGGTAAVEGSGGGGGGGSAAGRAGGAGGSGAVGLALIEVVDWSRRDPMGHRVVENLLSEAGG